MKFFDPPKNKGYLIFMKGVFLSLLFNSCSYSGKTARKLLSTSRATVYDMIVVPGVPLENGKWDRTMKGRVYWAKYLYDQGVAKNIMFSGSAVYTPYYEAIVMKLYAIAIGIPAEHLYTETRAEHSTENIYYSYAKANKLGFTKIALASDPFQTKQLRRFTHKRLSPDIGMIPMVPDIMEMLEPAMTDPVIDIRAAYSKDFISIRKREGIFKRLRGTMGRNIKEMDER